MKSKNGIMAALLVQPRNRWIVLPAIGVFDEFLSPIGSGEISVVVIPTSMKAAIIM